MEKNKTRKYLKYAIGEIVLVVIGILIALSLNNWNELRKNDIIKNQLIEDLILELQSSKKIIQVAIIKADTLVTKGKLFLKHIAPKEITIEMDSLKKLGRFVTDGIPYDLNLPIYEDSKSSGKLSMINNKNVLLYYAEIISANIGGSSLRKTSNHMWFNGSGWELRKEIGTSDVFRLPNDLLPQKFRLSEKEFYDILSRPSTYATLGNALQIKTIRVSYMNRISKGMTEVIELLENEKKDS